MEMLVDIPKMVAAPGHKPGNTKTEQMNPFECWIET
jgi:hypothetical protein